MWCDNPGWYTQTTDWQSWLIYTDNRQTILADIHRQHIVNPVWYSPGANICGLTQSLWISARIASVAWYIFLWISARVFCDLWISPMSVYMLYGTVVVNIRIITVWSVNINKDCLSVVCEYLSWLSVCARYILCEYQLGLPSVIWQILCAFWGFWILAKRICLWHCTLSSEECLQWCNTVA